MEGMESNRGSKGVGIFVDRPCRVIEGRKSKG
jgi:hypothetical protein